MFTNILLILHHTLFNKIFNIGTVINNLHFLIQSYENFSNKFINNMQ